MRSPFVENACLRFVLEAQNNDGGWGFHVGSLSRAEPTAWALIALIECASTPAHEEGISSNSISCRRAIARRFLVFHP